MADNAARAWFAAFVLVVFCLGGVIGYRFGTHMPRGPRFGMPGVEGPPGGPGRGGPGRGPIFGRGPLGAPLPPDMVDRLSRELQLDATQQDQVARILEDRRDHFEQIHRDARGRFDREQQDLQAAIRAVLRPDQQQKFADFLNRSGRRGR